ncbi:peptidylprolyl isomerase [Aureisphaera sp.]
MNKLLLLLVGLLVSVSTMTAQKKKDVLMTINENPITAQEFKRVYTKNLDLVQDEKQKTVEGYLDLFVDYKLKVAEAFEQKLHKKPSYKKDFAKYEEQLSRNYIYEDQVTEDLIREAYERGKEEINASHILILCNFDATPQDTLVAYNKIKAIRAEALLGENFNKLAVLKSEEPGIQKSKGNLGYFTAFTMVYPFETEAYKTKVGEVSNIVRTQYGYHILKINDRRKREPNVEVSHIMISSRNDSLNKAKGRIQDIYSLIQQGQSFEDLAKQYSDDKSSGLKGGKMRPFGKGDLKAPTFEDAAYALENEGDISEPIQTDFGWHILKLNKKGTELTYEEAKPEIEVKVKNGDRAKLVTNAVKNILKEKLNFTMVGDISVFEDFVGDDVLQRTWQFEPLPEEDNKVLFTLGDKSVLYNEFGEYVAERQKKARPYTQKSTLLAAFFDEFETKYIKDVFRKNLEATNEDYASIINEYRDGLLIFEVMSNNVWEKAKKDTIGQKEYYNKNAANYQWKDRVDVEIYTTHKEDLAARVQKLIEAGKSSAEIKEDLKEEGKATVIVTEGKFEMGNSKLPKDFVSKKGISQVYKQNGSFTIVNVKDTVPAGPKTFEEVKGKVISDYQTDVELKWMESLRSKYKVEINKKSLKKLKKELDS